MIGLQNSIYATLFPHLRKSAVAEDPAIAVPPVEVPPVEVSAGIPGTTLDYAAAQESYNQAQFDAAQPQPAPVTSDFDPTKYNQVQKTESNVKSALARQVPAMDTSGIEALITKTPYEAAKENAEIAAAAPIKKQDKWKQALWLTLQTANHIFNPQDKSEIEFLGEAKHRKAVERSRAQLAPLQAIESQKQAIENQKLATAKAEQEAQGKELAHQKLLGEIKQKDIENINIRIKPYLDTAVLDNKVDEKEAENLTRLTGLPFDASQWQKYIDKEINGKTFTRQEFDPRFAENKTVPVDIGETYRQTQIGKGEPVPVKTKDLPALVLSNEEKNTTRQESAARFTAQQQESIKKYNLDAEGKHQGDMQSWNKDFFRAKATTAKYAPILNGHKQAAESLKAQIAAETQYDTSEMQKQLNIEESKAAEAQGEIDSANIMLNVPKPTKPSQMSNSAPQGKPIGKPKKDRLGLFK